MIENKNEEKKTEEKSLSAYGKQYKSTLIKNEHKEKKRKKEKSNFFLGPTCRSVVFEFLIRYNMQS